MPLISYMHPVTRQLCLTRVTRTPLRDRWQILVSFHWRLSHWLCTWILCITPMHWQNIAIFNDVDALDFTWFYMKVSEGVQGVSSLFSDYLWPTTLIKGHRWQGHGRNMDDRNLVIQSLSISKYWYLMQFQWLRSTRFRSSWPCKALSI